MILVEQNSIATGDTEIAISQQCSKYSVIVKRNTATTGTISLLVKPAGHSTYMTLKLDGSSTIFDLSATAEPQAYGFEGIPISMIKISASTNGTFNVSICRG